MKRLIVLSIMIGICVGVAIGLVFGHANLYISVGIAVIAMIFGSTLARVLKDAREDACAPHADAGTK